MAWFRSCAKVIPIIRLYFIKVRFFILECLGLTFM